MFSMGSFGHFSEAGKISESSSSISGSFSSSGIGISGLAISVDAFEAQAPSASSSLGALLGVESASFS
jgi:hypothetical protein